MHKKILQVELTVKGNFVLSNWLKSLFFFLYYPLKFQIYWLNPKTSFCFHEVRVNEDSNIVSGLNLKKSYHNYSLEMKAPPSDIHLKFKWVNLCEFLFSQYYSCFLHYMFR